MMTVPYAILDEKREHPFTTDMELASLFILADARREQNPPSAMARIYYPLHIHRWDNGVLLIDLLKMNHASIRYNVIPDVDKFERALNASSDEPYAFRKTLKKEGARFKEFSGRKTIKIDGLIVQHSRSEELRGFVKDVTSFDTVDEPVVFNPVMKNSDIELILDSIRSLRESVEGDLNLLERAKRSMTDTLNIANKVLEEEIQNIQDRSAKVKARLKKGLDKVKNRHGKALKLELNKIRKEYKKKATPLRNERTSLGRKLARRRKKLETLKSDRDSAGAKQVSNEIKDLESKFSKVSNSVQKLEAWRDAGVEKAQDLYKAAIEPEEKRIREEEARSRKEVQKKRAEISEQEKAVKGVASSINKLISSKKNKRRSLSRLCFDIEAETTDLFVPFYVFQYDERFEFHPPVVACSARGFVSRFKRMLADNLQSKMTQLMKPRVDFLEKYLAKAVKAMSKKTSLEAEYRGALDRLNLLRSREAVDKIIIGLLKIQREGWISESEYIRLQEVLIQNLKLVS